MFPIFKIIINVYFILFLQVPIKLINFAIDMNDYNVPKTMLPHGKLKVDVNFYLRKKRVVCISTVVEVVPS